MFRLQAAESMSTLSAKLVAAEVAAEEEVDGHQEEAEEDGQ